MTPVEEESGSPKSETEEQNRKEKSQKMEGPRAVRPEEFDTLRALTDAVFRPNMIDEYPQLFNRENMENLRVFVDDGQCVSHVGMTERWASLLGCQVQVCCVGAVSTFEAYRGKGCASACFDDAVNKAYQDGVDYMIVSGDRNLYRMRGCMRVGRDTVFAPTVAALPKSGAGITVEIMKPEEELALVQDCYRQEPVRYIRPVEDYRYALQSGWVMNRVGDFLVIREGGVFRAYVIVQRPRDSKKVFIAEFAGDRHTLLAALPQIAQRYGAEQVQWQVLRHDTLFRSLCEAAGLSGTPVNTPGTVKLINFSQLMERLRPYWEERLGRVEAAKFSAWQREEQYGFRFGEAEFVTDRDTATRLLFGTVDGAEKEAIAQSALADVLKAVFPLPCLWYGINYV